MQSNKALACLPCAKGRFADKPGSRTCDACPPGRFAAAAGASPWSLDGSPARTSTPLWPCTSTTDDDERSVSWLAAVTVTSCVTDAIETPVWPPTATTFFSIYTSTGRGR